MTLTAQGYVCVLKYVSLSSMYNLLPGQLVYDCSYTFNIIFEQINIPQTVLLFVCRGSLYGMGDGMNFELGLPSANL